MIEWFDTTVLGWPYFGVVAVVLTWVSINVAWLGQRRKWRAETAELKAELGAAQRDGVRFLESVYVLTRAFHIRPQDNPYVVERLDNGAINDKFVTCFHCKRTRFEGHTPTCVWDFVAKNFTFAPDGVLRLKKTG